MSKHYDDYLKTDYWKAVSGAVKKRADYRCQVCNSQHDLQAHHRTYDHRARELDHLGDLICLCRRCHRVFHGLDSVAPPSPIQRRETEQPRKKKGKIRVALDLAMVAADMPAGEGDIELTAELLGKCRTANFGITNATIRAFGLSAPLVKGWPSRLLGKKISREAYSKALEGRYLYGTGKLHCCEHDLRILRTPTE